MKFVSVVLASCLLLFFLCVCPAQEMVPLPETEVESKLTIQLTWLRLLSTNVNELPEPIADLILDAHPTQVQVMGGMPINDHQPNTQTFTVMPFGHPFLTAGNEFDFESTESYLVVQLDESHLNSIIHHTKSCLHSSANY